MLAGIAQKHLVTTSQKINRLSWVARDNRLLLELNALNRKRINT